VKLILSSPSTAKVKNAWSYAFSPLHVLYLLVSHIQNIKWESVAIKKPFSRVWQIYKIPALLIMKNGFWYVVCLSICIYVSCVDGCASTWMFGGILFIFSI
jgi:hypothetical protein